MLGLYIEIAWTGMKGFANYVIMGYFVRIVQRERLIKLAAKGRVRGDGDRCLELELESQFHV